MGRSTWSTREHPGNFDEVCPTQLLLDGHRVNGPAAPSGPDFGGTPRSAALGHDPGPSGRQRIGLG